MAPDNVPQMSTETPSPESNASRAKPCRTWLRLFLAFFLAILLAGAAIGWKAYQFLHVPPESPGREVIVDIEPGQSLAGISRMLEQQNVISNSQYFRWYAQAVGLAASVRAGEFALHSGWTPGQVLEALTSGREYLHRLQIPEGLTWWQVGRIVEESGLADFDSFARAVADKKLLKQYSIPADHAEGYLFPETYYLPRPRNKDAKPVVEMLLNAFWKAADAKLWPNGRPDEDDIHRTVILASLVERETGLAEERERIAGVFANRLRLGMLLQCDPTIIYGLGPDFSERLRRVHLDDRTNPYNTYIHPGLPPGPIASPGLASLLAVLSPEEHNLLYFVSRKDGSHAFSRTLEEHNRAVRRYQLGR